MTLRTFSFGGGVQSTAALVLAAQRQIDFPVFLFCNVGEDSENPATLDYFREHAGPYAERHGIAMHELQRVKRDGSIETLYGRLTKEGSRSIPIPVRMSETGAPGTRTCTTDFKVRLVARWQQRRGATRENQAVCGLGISTDEIGRARSASGIPHQVLEYPLITLRLNRADCRRIIAAAGLPIPPKSACYFCPFHTLRGWQQQREEEPELFARSVALEALINERRAMLGKDPVWMTDKLVPLDRATSPHRQLPMLTAEGEDICDSGHCWV